MGDMNGLGEHTETGGHALVVGRGKTMGKIGSIEDNVWAGGQ